MKSFLLLTAIIGLFNACSKDVLFLSTLPIKAFSCSDKVAPKSLDFLEQKYHCRAKE